MTIAFWKVGPTPHLSNTIELALMAKVLVSPYKSERVGELTQLLASCNTWENWLLTLTGQHCGAGSGCPWTSPEGMRAGRMTLTPASGCIGWPSQSNVGELTLVVQVKES